MITDNAGFYGIFGKVHHGDYEKFRSKEGFTEDKHYALFTPTHLKNWLSYVGFRKIKINYFVYEKYMRRIHIPFIKLLSIFLKRLSPNIRAEAVK